MTRLGPLPRRYIPAVAYDEDLADRIRELLGPEHGIEEKRMFGGLAFLVGGNMVIDRLNLGR